MASLLFIGAGGHFLVVMDALHREAYSPLGIVEVPELQGECVAGVPIVGTDEDLRLLRAKYSHAFISLGSVGNTVHRRRLCGLAMSHDYAFASIVHEKAVISPSAQIGKGVFVSAGALVNAGACIGDMGIVNTGAIVEHECHIGDFGHIAPGAVLCGNVRVGADTHVGAGSVVRQGIVIGNNVTIGMGSVVVHDIPDGVIALGNPCRVVSHKNAKHDE